VQFKPRSLIGATGVIEHAPNGRICAVGGGLGETSQVDHIGGSRAVIT
jgi:hypothetical protein